MNVSPGPAASRRISRVRPSKAVRLMVYSPANLNAIDGSSVWTQTITLALAGLPEVETSILLSHEITSERLAGPLLAHPAISVIDPFRRRAWSSRDQGPLSMDRAAHLLSRMSRRFDILIVRGAETALRLSREPALNGKLWPYLTDVPQRSVDIDDDWRVKFADIMRAAPVLLCQTEELKTFLESSFESVAGKGRLLPPIVPDDVTAQVRPPPSRESLMLCYSGKFARNWNTYEMCELPALLARRNIDATLTMVGDKINRDPDWPEYVGLMRERLESSHGVLWVGGVSRSESLSHMAEAHVGLSWRSKELDDSLELSTKLLEYCSAGTPPILNRTTMHERVFGDDYPLFIDGNTEIVDLLGELVEDRGPYVGALERIGGIADEYTSQKASERLRHLIEE